MNQGRKFYSVNMFRICMDACGDYISGNAYSPMCKDEISFSGIGELLLKMDKLFDSIGYPQAFQNKRSFEKGIGTDNAYRGIPKPVRVAEEILEEHGRVCTYDVEVISRRNTSWQGVIYDTEGTEKARFDGEVKLLENLAELVKQQEKNMVTEMM